MQLMAFNDGIITVERLVNYWCGIYSQMTWREEYMNAVRDPEAAEISHLKSACELAGKDILEIGCGEGKFIRQYQGIPKMLVGIDPENTDLKIARLNSAQSGHRTSFVQTIGEHLPFSSRSFDIAIFASSL